MADSKTILKHSPSIVTRKTGNEYVLVPVKDNIADMNSVYTLNESAAYLWEQINGKLTVENLIEALVAEYDVTEEQAQKDVFEFIRDLKEYLIVED